MSSSKYRWAPDRVDKSSLSWHKHLWDKVMNHLCEVRKVWMVVRAVKLKKVTYFQTHVTCTSGWCSVSTRKLKKVTYFQTHVTCTSGWCSVSTRDSLANGYDEHFFEMPAKPIALENWWRQSCLRIRRLLTAGLLHKEKPTVWSKCYWQNTKTSAIKSRRLLVRFPHFNLFTICAKRSLQGRKIIDDVT